MTGIASEGVLIWMFAGLVGLMLTGLPLAFVLGGLAILFTVLLWDPAALTITVLQIFDTMRSDSLMSIPLYVMMASVLQRSGIIESLYKAMELWFNRLPGGLAIGTVIICTIMAANGGGTYGFEGMISRAPSTGLMGPVSWPLTRMNFLAFALLPAAACSASRTSPMSGPAP